MQTHESNNQDTTQQQNQQKVEKKNTLSQLKSKKSASKELSFGNTTNWQEIANNSPQAVSQRKAANNWNNSPLMVAQRKQANRWNNSPRMVAQRQAMNRLNNSPLMVAQRQAVNHWNNSPIQRKANPIQKKNNTGLPSDLQSGMENMTGVDLSDTKVHYNSSKPAQLQAHAYAQGTDIHIASGQEQHLGHELAHVVQQKQGRVKPTTQMKGVGVNDDSALEKEADDWGAKALNYSSSAPSNAVQMKKAGGAIQLAEFKGNDIDNKEGNLTSSAKETCGGTLNAFMRNDANLLRLGSLLGGESNRKILSLKKGVELYISTDAEIYNDQFLHRAETQDGKRGFIKSKDFEFSKDVNKIEGNSIKKVDSTTINNKQKTEGLISGAYNKIIRGGTNAANKKLTEKSGSLWWKKDKAVVSTLKSAAWSQYYHEANEIMQEKYSNETKAKQQKRLKNAAKKNKKTLKEINANVILHRSNEIAEGIATTEGLQNILTRQVSSYMNDFHNKNSTLKEAKAGIIKKASDIQGAMEFKAIEQAQNDLEAFEAAKDKKIEIKDPSKTKTTKTTEGTKDTRTSMIDGVQKGVSENRKLIEQTIDNVPTAKAGMNKLANLVDMAVPGPGTEASLNIKFIIPTPFPALKVEIIFEGEASKDVDHENKQRVGIRSSFRLGVALDLASWAKISGSFGLFIESEAANTSEAMELYSYAAFRFVNGLPLGSFIANRLWGSGDDKAGTANQWADDVERQYLEDNDDNYAAVGAEFKAEGEIGFKNSGLKKDGEHLGLKLKGEAGIGGGKRYDSKTAGSKNGERNAGRGIFFVNIGGEVELGHNWSIAAGFQYSRQNEYTDSKGELHKGIGEYEITANTALGAGFAGSALDNKKGNLAMQIGTILSRLGPWITERDQERKGKEDENHKNTGVGATIGFGLEQGSTIKDIRDLAKSDEFSKKLSSFRENKKETDVLGEEEDNRKKESKFELGVTLTAVNDGDKPVVWNISVAVKSVQTKFLKIPGAEFEYEKSRRIFEIGTDREKEGDRNVYMKGLGVNKKWEWENSKEKKEKKKKTNESNKKISPPVVEDTSVGSGSAPSTAFNDDDEF